MKNRNILLYNTNIIRNIIVTSIYFIVFFIFLFIFLDEYRNIILIFFIFFILYQSIPTLLFIFHDYHRIYIDNGKKVIFSKIGNQKKIKNIKDLDKIKQNINGKLIFYFINEKIIIKHDMIQDRKKIKEIIEILSKLKKKITKDSKLKVKYLFKKEIII